MLYRLEMGKTERAIFQNVERTKERLPPRIEGAPEVLLGLELYYNGFTQLQSTRGSLYSSEGPIPWTAMKDYCDEFSIHGMQRMDFFHLLSAMDHAYLEYKASKLPKS